MERYFGMGIVTVLAMLAFVIGWIMPYNVLPYLTGGVVVLSLIDYFTIRHALGLPLSQVIWKSPETANWFIFPIMVLCFVIMGLFIRPETPLVSWTLFFANFSNVFGASLLSSILIRLTRD